MTLVLILTFLFGAFVGVGLAHHFWYSKKAEIKRLWKEIFEITRKEVEWKEGLKDDSIAQLIIENPFEKGITKRKRIIKVLLEEYFDPEKDEEFIKDNRP